MEFRDALGVSRKFAVPLVDHLDGPIHRPFRQQPHPRRRGEEAIKLKILTDEN